MIGRNTLAILFAILLVGPLATAFLPGVGDNVTPPVETPAVPDPGEATPPSQPTPGPGPEPQPPSGESPSDGVPDGELGRIPPSTEGAPELLPLSDVAWPAARSADPGLALAQGLAALPSLTPAGVVAALDQYHYAVGHDIIPASMMAVEPVVGTFDAEDVLPFVYDVGDVDGDGYEDLAMALFCTSYRCFFNPGSLLNEIPPRFAGDEQCGTNQELLVVSGKNHTELWVHTQSAEFRNLLDPSTQLDFYCGTQIVVGLYPLPDGVGTVPRAAPSGNATSNTTNNATIPATATQERVGILLYSYAATAPVAPVYTLTVERDNPGPILIEHKLSLLDPANGEAIWTVTTEGLVYAQDTCFTLFRFCVGSTAAFNNRQNTRVVTAENLLVNPLPMVPTMRGVQLFDNATQSAIFQQGVSFEYIQLRPAVFLPGYAQSYQIIDDYQPREWAHRLDPATGAELWKADTFTRRDDASVMPRMLQSNTLGETFPALTGYGFEAQDYSPIYLLSIFGVTGDVLKANTQYWSHVPCCFDQTGDGIPDLTYSTMEWGIAPIPGQVTPGHHEAAASLVLFDGSTGQKVWEQKIENGTQRFINEEYDWRDAFRVNLDRLGDANGDGHDDILVTRIYLMEQLRIVLSVHDGVTGQPLWSSEESRQILVTPIGDADKDGGNDLLIIRWYNWQYPRTTFYDLTNVTITDVQVVSGRDGHELWRAESFNAPIDLYFMADAFRSSGQPDLDGDNVAEVWVDDPLVLDDGTVVHRQRVLAGSDGHEIGRHATVGLMAFPYRMGDADEDGRDDFGVLSGDPLDFWITDFNPDTSAEWSRRFVALRLADYTIAVPRMRVLELATPTGPSYLLHLQHEVTQVDYFGTSQSYYPQIGVTDVNGTGLWAFPPENPEVGYITVPGLSPASKAFDTALHTNALDAPAAATKNGAVIAAPGILVFVLVAAASNVLAARRWAK